METARLGSGELRLGTSIKTTKPLGAAVFAFTNFTAPAQCAASLRAIPRPVKEAR